MFAFGVAVSNNDDKNHRNEFKKTFILEGNKKSSAVRKKLNAKTKNEVKKPLLLDLITFNFKLETKFPIAIFQIY